MPCICKIHLAWRFLPIFSWDSGSDVVPSSLLNTVITDLFLKSCFNMYRNLSWNDIAYKSQGSVSSSFGTQWNLGSTQSMIKTMIKIITAKIIAMILMYLWLVVIMFDINYLSDKILLKQSWEACAKQLRVQCGSITLSKSFRQCLIRIWTGLQGTGYVYTHKARGTIQSALRSERACTEDPIPTLYAFQGEAITLVSCSHFPVTGCSLMLDEHWLCTGAALSPIWFHLKGTQFGWSQTAPQWGR